MKSPATIKDVANRAGVSVATVSRLLNGKAKGRASEEVANRVMQAVEDLNYRPSVAGRSLKTRQTRTIGVLIPSLSNPVFSEIFAGINKVVRSQGYTLLAAVSEYDADLEKASIQTFLDNQVDAAILTVLNPASSAGLQMLKTFETPHVLVFNQANPAVTEQSALVTVDNEGVGRDVAKVLIENGHERMAMIAGHFEASDRSQARRLGFEAEIAKAKLDAPIICEVDFVRAQVNEALDQLKLGQEHGATAIFCSNDFLAISVIRELCKRCIKVPDDVSVVGVDGIAIGALMNPSLASVVQPSREMGAKAAAVVLSQLRGEQCAATHVLPHFYQRGETVGSAATPTPPFAFKTDDD